MLDSLRERAVGEAREVGERDGAPHAAAARDRVRRPPGDVRGWCPSRRGSARAPLRSTRPSPWRTRPSIASGPPSVASSTRRAAPRRGRARSHRRPPGRAASESAQSSRPADAGEPSRRARRRGRPATRRTPARAAPPTHRSPAHRLREQLQLGVDREPHAPSSASTASVSAPSGGAGRRVAGVRAVDPEHAAEHRHRRRGPAAPRPGSSPFARTCSSRVDRLARRAPARPERRSAPSRASHSSTGAAAIAPLDRRRQLLLAGEHRGIGGNEVGRLDRRIVQAEQRRATPRRCARLRQATARKPSAAS